jgi:hypothetical protein
MLSLLFTDTQTDMAVAHMSSVEAGCSLLKMQLLEKTWSIQIIGDDDRATRFYTGLPSFDVFIWLFK